jgi:hypothetical protein
MRLKIDFFYPLNLDASYSTQFALNMFLAPDPAVRSEQKTSDCQTNILDVVHGFHNHITMLELTVDTTTHLSLISNLDNLVSKLETFEFDEDVQASITLMRTRIDVLQNIVVTPYLVNSVVKTLVREGNLVATKLLGILPRG